jgi:cleavage and polyadenylation specificity factor subunit 1
MDDEEHLRIMTFPTNVQLDFYMPFNKVPLRQSAHKITYDRTARKHVVATSTPTNFYLRDENDQLVGKADQPGYLFPQVDRHALQLVSPVTWRSVHTFDFSEYERVLALDYVTLENHASSTGYKSYIAVGTAMALGEDIAVKGSIYMFEVITVVPDPTDPQTNHKLKLVYREEVKGAVTCIGCMKGFLVTTVNKQIIVRTFEDNEHLNGIAFIDAQILPTTLNIVKNFVLLGDFTKSVWFIGFQEEPPKMQLLGKDVHQVEVSASEFVMDHKLLYFCVADSFGNLFLLTYSPFNIQSQGGQRLVRRGEMATGKHVLCMRRVVLDRDGLMQASLMGGKDGSLAMVLPLQERVYKRLLLLGSRMVSGVQHVAALNPKAMRIVAPKYRVDMQNLRSTLVDLDLMRNYLHIPTGHQKDLAKQVGTDAERVLADLQELDGMVQRL